MTIQAKKPNALLAAINRAVPKADLDPEEPIVVKNLPSTATRATHHKAHPEGKKQSNAREGTRLVAGHFDPKIARQIRIIAAEEDTTVQALLEEALDLLFVKKGKARIKDMKNT